MKKSHRYLLSLLSGLLLVFSWPPHGFPLLAFFAFVPLFFVSDDLLEHETKVPFWRGLWHAYIALLVWNIGTTWWIWNITPVGSIATFALNSFFMAIVFGCWQRFRTLRLPPVTSPLALIAFWCTWEYLHLNWDLTWPWLNIGNVFSNSTEFVQWYEITGTFGGTIWILVGNFLFYFLLKKTRENRKAALIHGIVLLLWIVLPAAASLIRYHSYKLPSPTADNSIEVVIVQQNTDPVEEQYHMNNLQHAQRLWEVASTQLTPDTRLLLCAETAIPWSIASDAIGADDCPTFNSSYAWLPMVDTLTALYPNLNFIVGLSTYKIFDHKATLTAQETHAGTFVDDYNTAACFNRNGLVGLYYKSKLVPGVEKMPYPQVFGFLEKLAIDLGGTSGSLGKDTEQRTFQLQDVPFRIGTAICYESAYGEHFGKFVKNGAQLMSVITNDGWWGKTPGHQQHFMMSKMRAVETRRTILRSANTGISAIIDERGDAHQQTKYDTRLALRKNVVPNDTITFYVKHGDYLARICVALTALIAIFSITLRIKRKYQQIKTK
jgi:apolipoprotein N-acyltransferase